ncbi:beta-lactamase class C and other penicillin binding proteins [alpha proteobacterium U9-1i]|nr:beta-lactamase class C and other penicillin binding proteins [alpha proteobacterium U9-1i]
MKNVLSVIALGAALVACATPGEHAAPASTQEAADVREVRVRAIVAALASGDAAQYERVSREHYAEALFARRTPEERANFVRMVASDFGAMRVTQVSEGNGVLTANVVGDSGAMSGALVFTFDDTAERRIARVDMQAEAGGGAIHGGPGARGPNVPPPPIDASMSADVMGAALESWLAPFARQEDFAGVVMVARNGAPFVTRAYGLANREQNQAANAATAYNVASIGKKFTQTAIARLIQEGRLSRTSTIGELLPDYPNSEAHAATIEQLVNMRGGISDFFGAQFDALPKARFNSNHAYYEYVSGLPQRFAPGARNEYCNGCYIVMGEIIERLSGMRYEDYIQRVVFAPAGMTRTGYFNSTNLPSNTARPYMRTAGPGSPYENTLDHHGVTGSGAGGVYSTVGDLLAFDNALRDGRLLNAELTAWVLGGTASAGRNTTSLGIAGGGGGASNILVSDGEWAVIVTGNVPELPERIGQALARQLS